MSSVILDSNMFVLLLVGMIDPEGIPSHKRTSIYTVGDFHALTQSLDQFDIWYTSPNIITEVDNLLHDTAGENRNKYLKFVKSVIQRSEEKYIESRVAVDDWHFDELGLTDSVILHMAASCDQLISGDSKLCDHARAMGIEVFDFKAYANERLRS